MKEGSWEGVEIEMANGVPLPPAHQWDDLPHHYLVFNVRTSTGECRFSSLLSMSFFFYPAYVSFTKKVYDNIFTLLGLVNLDEHFTAHTGAGIMVSVVEINLHNHHDCFSRSLDSLATELGMS